MLARVRKSAGESTPISFRTNGDGNYLSEPDSVDTSITGDIDVRFRGKLTSAAASDVLVGKWGAVASLARSYLLRVGGSTSTLSFLWSADGSAIVATVSVDVAGRFGELRYWRATLDVDNGLAGKTVILYDSTNGSTWRTLATSTSALTTSIKDSTAQLRIGSEQETANREINGDIYFAQVRSGINGTIAAEFDVNKVKVAGTRSPSSFVVSPSTWTATGSAWEWIS